MILHLPDCSVTGPALPESFLRNDIGGALKDLGLLSERWLQAEWGVIHRSLRLLTADGGPVHVRNHIVSPISQLLKYDPPLRQRSVLTREGEEDGGWLISSNCGARLRCWTVSGEDDLETPNRRGSAFRSCALRIAQRVLLAAGEQIGLLTNGNELRILLSDPVRADSEIIIALSGDGGWRNQSIAPDSFQLVCALASPQGAAALPRLLDRARLSQVRLTRQLQQQARRAIEMFIQGVLDHPDNRNAPTVSAADLWREGLVLIYRLLFILKVESRGPDGQAFSFASTSVWREMLSPNQALGSLVRCHIDQQADTGRMLEDGLRTVFRVFRDGLECSEFSLAPLGGGLFGCDTTPLLDQLRWGDGAVAVLLDCLLWTTHKGQMPQRVHYGSLGVEDLGGIYEALLELEPGIAIVPMVRLRRQRQEIVVAADAGGETESVRSVEALAPGRFFLRAGLGRKATGAYYTPDCFVRYIVHNTLGPRVDLSSPAAILATKVVDPAMGSGHFLVECCRYLADALYAACRRCDELAMQAERQGRVDDADTWRQQIADLPDPDSRLLAYMPSRSCEGAGIGVSQARALAICRRMVAVNCLYGVDRNQLAVELAKLSLWLESYAEGLPLTFLDHRLLLGDSLAGPFFADLATLPIGGGPLDPLLAHDVTRRLGAAVEQAMVHVRQLDATLGRDTADLILKAEAKRRMDAVLDAPRQLAQAWAGAVMLEHRNCDDEWLALAQIVAETGVMPDRLSPTQTAMLEAGRHALPWDLTFPEVFRPNAKGVRRRGFSAILGNPPWEVVQYKTKEFVSGFDLSILDAATKKERLRIENRVLADRLADRAFAEYRASFEQMKRVSNRLYRHQRVDTGNGLTAGNPDLFRLFAERKVDLTAPDGAVGMLVPASFHANEGTTAIRRLYLQEASLETCFSFENRRGWFEIDARIRFDLIIARKPGPTRQVACAFQLTGLEDLTDRARRLNYDADFIANSDATYLTFPELRHRDDLAIAQLLWRSGTPMGAWCDRRGIQFGRDLHMTDDSGLFRSRPDQFGAFLLHEGKTFHQFTDKWDSAARYCIDPCDLSAKPGTVQAARNFRIVFRDIAHATNERTMIATIMPPGVVFGHTATVERAPGQRHISHALVLCALLNSFTFDWLVRRKAGSHLSLYIVRSLSLPDLDDASADALATMTLRLCANHAGYSALLKSKNWPVIADVAERNNARATIDAIVARAYGLSRNQYQRVLQDFSHKSVPSMPDLCLTAFDAIAKAADQDHLLEAH